MEKATWHPDASAVTCRWVLSRPDVRSITEAEVPADRAGLQDRQPRRGELFRSRGKCDMNGRLILDLVVAHHDLGFPGAPAQLETLLQRRDRTARIRVPVVLDPVLRRCHH